MAQTVYANLYAFYNGSRLKQLTSAAMTTNSGDIRVDLLNEGLGGFSEGSGDVTIELGFAVPIGGTEVDYQGDSANHRDVVMQFQSGGKVYTGTGRITSTNISQNVNSATEGTASWTGPLSEMR
jgi:hypothetical protein